MVEIETGLKHSMEDFKERIAGTNLRVVIIVPNKELVDKYQGFGERVSTITMDSLREMLTEPEKNSNYGRDYLA